MIVLEKENKSLPEHMESLSIAVKTALTVQHVILNQTRRIMDDLDFIEYLAPVASLVSDTSKKLLSDMTIHKQTLIRSFERIYTISPTFKKDPRSFNLNSRHLYESYQLHLEMREESICKVMDTTELFLERLMDIVNLVCSNVLENCNREFSVPSIPFSKVPYSKLYDVATSFDNSFTYGEEIPPYVKEEISKRARKPLWVVDYPINSKRELYSENGRRPGFSSSVDLIYPNGYGDAATGGERVLEVEK